MLRSNKLEKTQKYALVIFAPMSVTSVGQMMVVSPSHTTTARFKRSWYPAHS